MDTKDIKNKKADLMTYHFCRLLYAYDQQMDLDSCTRNVYLVKDVRDISNVTYFRWNKPTFDLTANPQDKFQSVFPKNENIIKPIYPHYHHMQSLTLIQLSCFLSAKLDMIPRIIFCNRIVAT